MLHNNYYRWQNNSDTSIIISTSYNTTIHQMFCFKYLLLLLSPGVLSLSPSSSKTSKDCRQQASDDNPIGISRRSCLSSAFGGFVSGSILLSSDQKGPINHRVAFASDLTTEVDNNGAEVYRTKLLQLIQSNKASEAEVLAAIEKLVPYDPSKKAAATFKDDLSGEWKLLWSAKAEAFSPLLKLPKPFKPDSFQYLGQASASEVGPDRVAQGLTGGALLGTSQLWLSSGVQTASDDPSVLEIYPPFRFEYGGRYQSGQSKKLLVEGTYLMLKMLTMCISGLCILSNKFYTPFSP